MIGFEEAARAVAQLHASDKVADSYVGGLSVVKTDEEFVISKHRFDDDDVYTKSFILQLDENSETSEIPDRIDMPNAQLLREADGDVYILDVERNTFYYLWVEDPLPSLSAPDAREFVVKSWGSIATGIAIDPDYVEREGGLAAAKGSAGDVAARGGGEGPNDAGTSAIRPTGPVGFGPSPGPYDPGPYDELSCKCIKPSPWGGDDCDSGGRNSTGCSISVGGGRGCSVSGCEGVTFACCNELVARF